MTDSLNELKESIHQKLNSSETNFDDKINTTNQHLSDIKTGLDAMTAELAKLNVVQEESLKLVRLELAKLNAAQEESLKLARLEWAKLNAVQEESLKLARLECAMENARNFAAASFKYICWNGTVINPRAIRWLDSRKLITENIIPLFLCGNGYNLDNHYVVLPILPAPGAIVSRPNMFSDEDMETARANFRNKLKQHVKALTAQEPRFEKNPDGTYTVFYK